MSSYHSRSDLPPSFPRYFKICGHWINSYKVFLCVGIYLGTLVSAAMAERSGIPPLRMGAACLACAIVGLVGARIYHLLVFAPDYLRKRSITALWDSSRGGWSVFGALVTIVPFSFAVASVLQISLAVFWDHMSAGILMGGFWVRLGCVFNGCCAGRQTSGWFGVRLHDTRSIGKRRIPVQLMEMAWWLLGWAWFIWLWPRSLAPGSYAIGVLGWYGLGRFWLEPLRDMPDLVLGRVRINQVVAGALAIAGASALILRSLAN